MRKLLFLFLLAVSLQAQASIGGKPSFGGKGGIGGSAPGGAISVPSPNESCQTQSSTSPIVCTWITNGANPIAGRSIACFVGNYNSGSTFAVTDTQGDTYSGEGSVTHLTNLGLYGQMFHFFNIPGTILVTTLTVSGAAANFAYIHCGDATTTGLGPATDGTCTADGSSTSVSCGSAIVTTQKDWVFCGGETQGGSTASAGTGFALTSSAGGNLLGQFLVQGAAGSITPNVNVSPSDPAGMICSAYKP